MYDLPVLHEREQRQCQHLADVAQENAERPTRGEPSLDPNTPERREKWNTAQVNSPESLFPSSDNLIFLMFIVESDLTEAQRETSSPSLNGMNITAYTFKAVRTTFLELISFTPRERTRQQHEQNRHRRRLC